MKSKERRSISASTEFIDKKMNDVTNLKTLVSEKFSTELTIVTKEMADEFLTHNTKNRRLERGRIDSYKRQLMDDVWEFNAQPIIFDVDGVLADGQGRCTAISESGVPALCLVVRGVPTNAFATMDMGKSRSFADVLSAKHNSSGVEGKLISYVAAMSKKVLEWNNSRFGSHGCCSTRNTSNNLECIKETDENIAIYMMCAEKASSLCHPSKFRFFPNGKLYGAFMVYLISSLGWSETEVFPFFEALVDRQSVYDEGHPIMALRSVLEKAAQERGYLTDKDRYHIFAKVWNAYVLKKPIKKLSRKGEEQFLDKESFETIRGKYRTRIPSKAEVEMACSMAI